MWKVLVTTYYDGNDEALVFDLNQRVSQLRQSGKPLEEYYNMLQGLWRKIDFCHLNPMTNATDIEKFREYIEKTRMYTFLDGLDDRLDSTRAYVLQISPFPTVEQEYGVVRREAMRQMVMLKGEEGMNSMVMISKGYSNPNSQEKLRLKCTHCGKTGHVKERRFKLVGYPEWFKEKKGNLPSDRGRSQGFAATGEGQTEPNRTRTASGGKFTTREENSWTVNQVPDIKSTENIIEVCKARVQLCMARDTGEPSTSEAKDKQVNQGMSFLIQHCFNDWVIDSDTTDHMTFIKGDLKEIKRPRVDKIVNANEVESSVECA